MSIEKLQLSFTNNTTWQQLLRDCSIFITQCMTIFFFGVIIRLKIPNGAYNYWHAGNAEWYMSSAGKFV